jgi:hypothetical protein
MRNNREFAQFNQAMETILRADPKAVREAMEAEKKANAEKRKAKKTPALGRAASGRD